MRLIFAGTPEFAERALAALIDAGHEVALVLTRPDKPAGRGQKVQHSPVKRLALGAGLRVEQPRSLRDPQAQAMIDAVGADAMVVAAYGLILPAPVLAAPRLGCINIHASLLPRWRGAAPIQRAIEAGDTRTGITIMQMDAGLDTGPMLLAREIPIGPSDTGGSLHERLAALGAAMIVEALRGIGQGTLAPLPQPADGATYAHKIEKAETWLDWRDPAARLADRIRAFDPSPGTALRLERGGDALKLWNARALARPEPLPEPGTVVEVGHGTLVVACGEGALSLLELQKPGGRRMAVVEFLRGFQLAKGERFARPGDARLSPGQFGPK